jgi:hypothetical protein
MRALLDIQRARVEILKVHEELRHVAKIDAAKTPREE